MQDLESLQHYSILLSVHLADEESWPVDRSDCRHCNWRRLFALCDTGWRILVEKTIKKADDRAKITQQSLSKTPKYKDSRHNIEQF
jgi:hypothetical protein